MEPTGWQAALNRIAPQDADDLDPLLADFAGVRAEAGPAVFPEALAALRPETALKRPDAVVIGLRAGADRSSAADRAARVLGFAAERDVDVVVLADADVTGFERFGFRVERLAGETEAARAACEAQIRRLWNIDLVL